MKNPLVSIIVPNFNYGRFLNDRLNSILNQSFKDFEIIVLDDCSTDDSKKILDSFRNHPKVTAIKFNDTNSGSPFIQWKKGIEMACGKYVWIAEADDLADSEFLMTHVRVLESDPRITLSFCGAVIISSDGTSMEKSFDEWTEEKLNNPEGWKAYAGIDYIVHNMYWNNAIYNASGAVFRRDAVSPSDLDDIVGMKNSGDWLFWTRLIAKGKVAEIYRTLNRYRVHSNNTTTRGQHNGNIELENIAVMEYIERNFPVGPYRRNLRHGLLVKRIKRSEYSPELQNKILRRLKETSVNNSLAYGFERIHKLFQPLFPSLMTPAKDRI